MENLSELLEPLLGGTDVPSVVAAVVFGSEVRAAGAIGVRKRGDPTPVTLNDKYHIGSCAKAMTATLTGILVERGVLSWETRLLEVFPDVDIHPGYHNVTLEQLLSHTSGLPPFTDTDEDEGLAAMVDFRDVAPSEHRQQALSAVLAREPNVAPGTQFLYSNMGYVAAGATLEHLTQIPFETLIVQELFVPLGITSAGFGAAGTPGHVDEPWGHRPEPVEPGPGADLPPFLSPAGMIHMSITDFARHAAFHLTGEPQLLARETLERLHTPMLENYGLGWGVFGAEWAGGTGLTHAGSNGLSYAVIGLALPKNKAIVCAANQGDENGSAACTAAFKELVKRYLT